MILNSIFIHGVRDGDDDKDDDDNRKPFRDWLLNE